MSLYDLRAIAIRKGYVIHYTFGISRTASMSSWNPHRKSWEIDMSDPIKGRQKLEELVLNL